MISPEAVADYNKQGFSKAPVPLFSTGEFSKLTQSVLKAIDRQLTKKSGFMRQAWLVEPDLIEFACNDKLIEFLKPFIGPDIGVFASSIYKKEANSIFEAPWHSDVSNNEEMTRGMRAASITIAITDCTKATGCLEYAPGSHKKRAREHHYDLLPENSLFGEKQHYELTDDEVKELATPVFMELNEGEVSIADLATVHRSGPNKSDQDRIILVFRYFSTSPDTQLTDAAKNYWRGNKYTFLVSGEDFQGICRHSLVPKKK